MKQVRRLLSYLLTVMVIVTAITSTGVVAHASMLPLEEVKAYLVLSGYSKEDLSAMSVDKMIDMLEDSDGNKIEIADDATTVWKYIKDKDDGIEVYEAHTIGMDSEDNKINLYPGDDVDTFQFEIIIGKDGQLNNANRRYIVTAYISDEFKETLDIELYDRSNGNNSKIEPIQSDLSTSTYSVTAMDGSTISAELFMYGKTFKEGFSANNTYINITSEMSKNPNVKAEIYEWNQYKENLKCGKNVYSPITSKVLNQDMSSTANGLLISDLNLSDYNTLIFVVFYYSGDKLIDAKVIGTLFAAGYIAPTGEMYSKDDNGKVINVTNSVSHYDYSNTGAYGIQCELSNGYAVDGKYNFKLNIQGTGQINQNFNEIAEKAVVGHYNSLNEAIDQKDIKSELLTESGYTANYSGDGVDFTVFFPSGTFSDGNVKKFTVNVIEYQNSWIEYTDKPIIGQKDPWFNVTGAIDGNGKEYSVDKGNAYVVENGKNINMDTYYGYGYQTVFIKDDSNSDVDLSNMKPIFNYTDENRLYAVSEDTGDKVDETHTRDFAEANQQYTLVFDDNENQKRNYWITYKKLNNNGPELYVLGPQEREVIFDDYFGDKHDILIANVGNAPLTNLSVELRNAENVKLDGYWTVGGKNNDTLAAFSTTSKTTQYGELPNMGKIRLVPDGNGEVKGTVVIKAGEVGKEQEVVISLNGTVKTPEIITDNLSDAVKYVPYQYIIATDNIHDNIREEFEIVEGEQALPKGLVFNKKTGEISGVPQVPDNNAEYEDYEFTIKVNYFNEGETESFDSVSKKFKLRVNSNTNDNVYNASDEGYTIKEHIGAKTENSHEFVLENIEEDQLFVSNGSYGEFVDLWLNGEKLEEGIDYDSESGSTKITIKSQTFENKADKDGTNTIAMEFRNDDNEVNRTAQNFNIKKQSNTDKDKDKENKEAADKVVALIDALPNSVSISDKSAVESARNAYDALTSAQKDCVPESSYNKLVAAENAIDTLNKNRTAAQPVINLIDEIPTSITLDCKDKVTAARSAYDKLTAEQKEYVTNYSKLSAAENAIETLEAEEQARAKDRAAAEPVIELIDAIPSTVTLESENAITTARNAYNILLSNQKGYVTNYSKLTNAEDKLAELKKDTDEKTVNMVCSIIDKDGKALVDYIAEIHSNVLQSRTDENGFARFSNVLIDEHTLIIKDSNGIKCAEKTFKIVEGDSLSISGNEITAKAGSTFTLSVSVNDGNISFLKVESGDKAPELENEDDKTHSIDISDSAKDEENIDDKTIDITNNSATSPQTGDNRKMYAWYLLLIASWSTLVLIFISSRKKKSR
mgnify:CR=1 FL=1